MQGGAVIGDQDLVECSLYHFYRKAAGRRQAAGERNDFGSFRDLEDFTDSGAGELLGAFRKGTLGFERLVHGMVLK
ncbi:Uncharacterised protein [Bordetella pertussis]|nr:Uncharacterised protein [Bordetella pertussis]